MLGLSVYETENEIHMIFLISNCICLHCLRLHQLTHLVDYRPLVIDRMPFRDADSAELVENFGLVCKYLCIVTTYICTLRLFRVGLQMFIYRCYVYPNTPNAHGNNFPEMTQGLMITKKESMF